MPSTTALLLEPATLETLEALASIEEEKLLGLLDKQKQRLEKFIPSLDEAKLTREKAYILGNDPTISGLERYKDEKKETAVIGTSCLRSLLVACQLGARQLFIIDNSAPVCHLWRALQTFAYHPHNRKKEQFLGNLPHFLSKNAHLIERWSLELEEDIIAFLMRLFDAYSFDSVRNLLLKTVVIGQSWENKETCKQAKKMLAALGIDNIFVYLSNILPFIHSTFSLTGKAVFGASINTILSNVVDLNPRVAIHTSLGNECFYLIENQDPDFVKRTMKLDKPFSMDLMFSFGKPITGIGPLLHGEDIVRFGFDVATSMAITRRYYQTPSADTTDTAGITVKNTLKI